MRQLHHLVLIDIHSNSQEPTVLFVSRKDGVSELPVVQLENEAFSYSGEKLVHEVQSKFGIKIALLRCLSSVYSARYGSYENIVVGELLSDDGHVGGALFTAGLNQMLANLPLDNPALSSLNLAKQWLAGDSNRRVPWSRPGWFRNASAWLAEKLRSLGFGEMATITQIRAWERSCVLCAENDSDRFFLKCVPEIFRHEPALTLWLSQHESGSVPIVLDCGHKSVMGHYLLMRDYRGEQLTTIADIKQWESAIEDYASLQRRLGACTDALGSLGVPFRSVRDLPVRADRMFSDRRTMQNCLDGLNDAEATELDKLLPTLRRATSIILAKSLGPSLDHGDLWSGQIIVGPAPLFNSTLFTDWSDCAVSHPFMGITFFCDDADETLLRESSAYDTLRHCYLDRWSGMMPSVDLRAQFDSAELLGPLQNALLYYECILPSMELAWEMEPMFMFHLRLLIKVAKRSALAG